MKMKGYSHVSIIIVGAFLFSSCQYRLTLRQANQSSTVVSSPALLVGNHPHDFGAVFMGTQSSGFIVTIQNTGDETATGCSAPIVTHSDFTLSSDTCGTQNLAAGASCQVTVKAAPNSFGPLTGLVSRTCSVGGTVTSQVNALAVRGKKLAANGGVNNCSIRPDASVKCWGSNTNGELGNGTFVSSATPVDTGISAFSIASGEFNTPPVRYAHQCAILTDFSVKCWGRNNQGQLGNGTTTNSNIPVDTGITQAIGLSLSTWVSCAVLADRTIKCWGQGFGSTPVAISNVSGVIELVQEGGRFCGIIEDLTVKCWNTPSPVPTAISGLTNVVQLSASYEACARHSDSTVQCWPFSSSGPLSTPTGITTSSFITPFLSINAGVVKSWDASQPYVTVPTLSTAKEVMSTYYATAYDDIYGGCAQLTNDEVWCWDTFSSVTKSAF